MNEAGQPEIRRRQGVRPGRRPLKSEELQHDGAGRFFKIGRSLAILRERGNRISLAGLFGYPHMPYCGERPAETPD